MELTPPSSPKNGGSVAPWCLLLPYALVRLPKNVFRPVALCFLITVIVVSQKSNRDVSTLHWHGTIWVTLRPPSSCHCHLLLWRWISSSILFRFVRASSVDRTCCPYAPTTLFPVFEVATVSALSKYQFSFPSSRTRLYASLTYICICIEPLSLKAFEKNLVLVFVWRMLKRLMNLSGSHHLFHLSEEEERWFKIEFTRIWSDKAGECEPSRIHSWPAIFVMRPYRHFWRAEELSEFQIITKWLMCTRSPLISSFHVFC